MKRKLLASVLSSLLPALALAATQWTGGGGADKQITTAANWDNGVPTNTNVGTVNSNFTAAYDGPAKLNSRTINFRSTSKLTGADLNWRDGTVTLFASSQWNAPAGTIVMGYDTGPCFLNVNDTASLTATKLTVGATYQGTVTQNGGTVTLGDLAIASGNKYDFPSWSKGTLVVASNGPSFVAANKFSGLIQAGKITLNGATVSATKFVIDNTSVPGYSLLSVKHLFSVYDRPLHLTYALSNGKSLTEPDQDILDALDQVPGRVTSVNPFLLNVDDPSLHATMLNALKARGIAAFVGVGKAPGTPNWSINSANMRNLADALVTYTDSVRIENTQGFYDLEGQAPIQNYINYLLQIGFKHIMMNPWPVNQGVAVPLTGPESTIYQVLLPNFDHDTGEVFPDPTNWWAGNQTKIDAVRAYLPSVKILINYESAPQHVALVWTEHNSPGGSIAAMEITAGQCETSVKDLKWCPPWTKIYDPLVEGTWSWIADRLGDMNSTSLPGPALNPDPKDGQNNVSITKQLTWLGGALRSQSKIYFGTSSNPPLVATKTATNYNPGTLLHNKTYYWKVVETNQYGDSDSVVWSFTTN